MQISKHGFLVMGNNHNLGFRSGMKGWNERSLDQAGNTL